MVGQTLGSYQILNKIGEGGMGQVYQARDLRLNRDVAIKILPPLFADDPERLGRFEREAQVLAALNHPNIAHIYGIEDNAGHKGLVMELVPGDDLSVLIARTGALPLSQTIAIARQIADALDCAHEQGIVHRDLKPANIKVRDDGTVKVLDFGLAKLAEPLSGISSSTVLSPVITSPATQLGVILGTAAYMAPEQARGKPVDKRADVWAFGLVLYEMLTGKRAFDGSEISDTMAAILLKDPDWSALPADTPPALSRLLRRCVHKERKQRLADMSDARLELEEALAPAAPAAPAVVPAPEKRSRWPIAGAAAAGALAVAIMGAAALWMFRPTPPAAGVTRFTVTLPEGVEFTNAGRRVVAISPDGRKIVFVANRQLYLRSAEDPTPKPITGSATTGAVVGPEFSPDGQHVAYFSEGALRKIAVAGGTPMTLAEVSGPYGMHWVEGMIYMGGGRAGILRVAAGGGKPETVAKVEGVNALAQGPRLLPGGEWIIFTIVQGGGDDRWDKAQIVAQSLRSNERKVLIEGGADVRYSESGHLLYSVSGVVYAVPFNAKTAIVTGTARPAIEGVSRGFASGAAQFATSSTGTLVHVPGPTSASAARRMLGFLDRSGAATPLKLPEGGYDTPRVSPDGTRVAVANGTDEWSIWIYDLSGATAIRRLTFGGNSRLPVWSPDGRQIIFQSDREGDRGLWVQSADVSGSATRVTKAGSDQSHGPTSWSPDGQHVAFSLNEPGTGSVQILSMKNGTVKPFHDRAAGSRFVRTAAAAFSPDGHWLAYSGDVQSTVSQVFVEPFPANGTRYQIGDAGQPVWSRTGRELFVTSGPNFVSYAIQTEPRFSFSVGPTIPTRPVQVTGPAFSRNYDPMPDGKRLLAVLRPVGTDGTPRDIVVTLNWFEELKGKQ